MNFRGTFIGLFILSLICFNNSKAAVFNCDLSQYRAQPGLEAKVDGNVLIVDWIGEGRKKLRAQFEIHDNVPRIKELSVESKDATLQSLAKDLTPEFSVTTGIRKTNHGLPEENRWDVFWDVPLNRTNEVRRATASFRADRCAVKTDGVRLEISFPGLTMGTFSGSLQFTVYRGANLLRQEAIAKTAEPSVAYKYEGGLSGLSAELLPRVIWKDVTNQNQSASVATEQIGQKVVMRARNRVAIAEGARGSVAVLPTPHQFFFARELEVNLGYVWRRKDGDNTFSLGIRHADKEEGYNRAWIDGVFPCYNAPSGTWQHMSVYFYLSADPADKCRDAVMAYTHGDRYKPLPGYKTMVTHFHTAFTMELMASGNLDTTTPWIPIMKNLGINIAHIFDFHGDGHPHDPGPVRLKELENYFEACRRHSDREFLILPGEEANEYLGGHYNIMFPKPVYWTHVRGKDRPFIEDDAKYGKVYHTGDAADVFQLMQKEDALVWQTHPRTKGSTGYPDKIRDENYLRDDHWLGTAFKALPTDLSQKRLSEVRSFGTLDDMNNWGAAKFMVGEVDTYKKYPDYDVYGDFNVNYVKLDAVPSFSDWSAVNRALRAGDFFVTTGEILIRSAAVEGAGNQRRLTAEIEWTYPLEFVELVWGDGKQTARRVISATDRPPFSFARFTIPFDASNVKWVRFAAWDSAGNGAFTQPVHLK